MVTPLQDYKFLNKGWMYNNYNNVDIIVIGDQVLF